MSFSLLISLLEKKKKTISSIESLTGGLFSSKLTAVSGASKVFSGTLVTYSNESKIKAGVKEETIDTYGAISSQCSLEMAKCCKEYFLSNIAVSFTGNAGPTASENKDVGLVYITIIVDKKIETFKLSLSGDREMIRERSVLFALNKLIEFLK